MVVLTCPTDFPTFHFTNADRGLLAEDGSQFLITETTPRFQRIAKMVRPVIGFLFADGGRHRHLRHDRRTAAAD